jgi:hypothetical protein
MVSGGMMVSTSLVVLLLAALAAGRQVEVEDVTARQLEAAIQTEDILAVFWCKYTGAGGDGAVTLYNSPKAMKKEI